jgi:hypothetical protein
LLERRILMGSPRGPKMAKEPSLGEEEEEKEKEKEKEEDEKEKEEDEKDEVCIVSKQRKP